MLIYQTHSKLELQKYVRLQLPSVDLNHLQMHLRGGRTFAAHERLWSLVVLTKGLRENILISNTFRLAVSNTKPNLHPLY